MTYTPELILRIKEDLKLKRHFTLILEYLTNTLSSSYTLLIEIIHFCFQTLPIPSGTK